MIQNRRYHEFLTATALSCGLYFRAPRELAVISGAGIAGLAASFVLLARGFNVLIAEGRTSFSRFNVINLNVEVQSFLQEFGLLQEFEESVAARIQTHKIVHVTKDRFKELTLSDVSQLQLGNRPFEPENYPRLFNEDGIYSVKIRDLQTFLAKKALEAGARILGNVEVNVLARKVEISGKELYNSIDLKPDLFFVAEGAHSQTTKQLGMGAHVVKNECSGESWIFGNIPYSGKKTYVISLIDTSKNKLEIANVIFNARIQEINIAVTSPKSLTKNRIQSRILGVANRLGIAQPLTAVVARPVHVENVVAERFSKDHTFLIGDAAGCSSPLAGLGGTLCLTLVLRAIRQLLDDRQQRPESMHTTFKTFSEAYVLRWIKKSQDVKKFCLGILSKEA